MTVSLLGAAQVELAKQKVRVGPLGRSLTDLSRPAIDWTALGAGMGVKSSRAATVEEFCQVFKEALANDGPWLIEACLL